MDRYWQAAVIQLLYWCEYSVCEAIFIHNYSIAKPGQSSIPDTFIAYNYPMIYLVYHLHVLCEGNRNHKEDARRWVTIISILWIRIVYIWPIEATTKYPLVWLQNCIFAWLPWWQGLWGQNGAHLGPTHSLKVMHTCVSELSIGGSNNGL